MDEQHAVMDIVGLSATTGAAATLEESAVATIVVLLTVSVVTGSAMALERNVVAPMPVILIKHVVMDIVESPVITAGVVTLEIFAAATIAALPAVSAVTGSAMALERNVVAATPAILIRHVVMAIAELSVISAGVVTLEISAVATIVVLLGVCVVTGSAMALERNVVAVMPVIPIKPVVTVDAVDEESFKRRRNTHGDRSAAYSLAAHCHISPLGAGEAR